ncbi:MAG: ABC transporter substrate-binding protein [Anaerolineae bacterium]|jgi:multiple sugar transport system substrate-binding protein
MAACAGAPGAQQAGQAPAAATSAAQEPAAAAGEKIELKLMSWDTGIGDTAKITEVTLPAFMEENPDITVTYEAPPWAEYWTKIQTLAASGGMPDAYGQSVAYGWDHANKGISLNLQPYIEADLNTDDYFMEMELGCHRYPNPADGDLYSFPVRWVGEWLFYNVDIFDAVGAPYPDETWTYDDMLAAAKNLTKVSGDTTEIYGMVAPSGHIALDAMIKANGGQVLSPDYKTCLLNEPEAIESIRWAVNCVLEHKVAPTPAALAGFPEGAFASQAVAMILEGSYAAHNWKDAEFNWDVAYVPLGKVGRVMYAGPDSISIAKQSAHKDAAWALIKYWVGEKNQMAMDDLIIGGVPFLKKAAYSDTFLNREGTPKGIQSILDMASVGRGADFGSQWMEWRVTIMNQELDLAYLGERSVEESVEAATAAIQQVLDSIQWPE